MRRLLPGLAAIAASAAGAACTDGAAPLVVDIPATSSGLLGIPTTFSVIDADGTIVRSGPSPGRPFEVTIHPGAWLSVFEDESSSPTARYSVSTTITGLDPGDHVRHAAAGGQAAVPVGDLHLDLDGVGPLPDGSSYLWVGPCSQSVTTSPHTDLSFFADCAPAGPFTVDGYVLDAGGPQQHAAIAVAGFAAGATVTAHESWGEVPSRSITVRGLGPELTSASVTVTAGWGLSVTRTLALPATGDATAVVPRVAVPRGVASVDVVTARAGAGGQEHRFGVDAAAPSVVVDVGAHPLPWITSAPVAAGGGIAWTEDGPGTPDLVRLTASRSSGIGPPFDGGSSEVIGPPGTSLPAGSPDGTLSLVDCSEVDGYDEVKADHARACATLAVGAVHVVSTSPAAGP
ncbi:MAG TPA: hypothetical protein VHE35_08115 [Kofleriaceae bacterium]|nr:hypothetical protein [Kofleriaceae bacterium]